jgi:hypothetical protein
MLADYPTFFNEDEILNPTEWNEDYGVVETVNETEAGTDIHAVTRYDKLTVEATYYVTDSWARLFYRYSKEPSFTLKKYSVLLNDYEERTVVLRDFKINRLPKSERIRVSNGLYAVSFSLEEL